MSDQNNRCPSSSGFTLGLIFGLLVGFVMAVLIYKNNPRVFSQLADKLSGLIKDIVFGSTKISPQEKTTSVSPKTIAVSQSSLRRPRRPKTFVRPRS